MQTRNDVSHLRHILSLSHPRLVSITLSSYHPLPLRVRVYIFSLSLPLYLPFILRGRRLCRLSTSSPFRFSSPPSSSRKHTPTARVQCSAVVNQNRRAKKSLNVSRICKLRYCAGKVRKEI